MLIQKLFLKKNHFKKEKNRFSRERKPVVHAQKTSSDSLAADDSVTFEGTGGSELTKSVAYHVFRDEDGNE